MAKNCINCSNSIDDNVKFCPYCGANNAEPAPAPAPAPAVPDDEGVTIAADPYPSYQPQSSYTPEQPAYTPTNEINFDTPSAAPQPENSGYWNQQNDVQPSYYPPVENPAPYENNSSPYGSSYPGYPPVQPEKKSGGKKWLFIGIGGGVLLIIIIVVLILVLGNKNPQTTPSSSDGPISSSSQIIQTEAPTDPPTEPPTDPPTDAIDEMVGEYDMVTFISDGEDYSPYISMLGETGMTVYSNSTAMLVLNDDKVFVTIDTDRQTMTDKTGDTFPYTWDGRTITIIDDDTKMGFKKKL